LTSGVSRLTGVELRELAGNLRDLLAQIGDRCRFLLIQHIGFRRTTRELAEEAHLTDGAVRVQVTRCLKGLRAILAKNAALVKQLKDYLR
jgi:DNA-directed RNA polymerase specialized sigma24 family protein